MAQRCGASGTPGSGSHRHPTGKLELYVKGIAGLACDGGDHAVPGAGVPANNDGLTQPLNSWTTRALTPGVTYYWRVRPRVQGDGTPVAWVAGMELYDALSLAAGT